MRGTDWKKLKLKKLTKSLVNSYEHKLCINHVDGLNLPNVEHIEDIIDDFFKIIFPGFTGKEKITSSGISFYVGNILDNLFDKMFYQIHRALEYKCPDKSKNACKLCDCESMAHTITVETLEKLPKIRKLLKADVRAAFDGDPAAQSLDEIILSYPFIKAITVHRISNTLYEHNVPLIPRMMSEWVHRETGIDIHPGAKIGHSFFIDHGTGVVIGETTIIGNNVKIYQGVTLGALSFPKDERGRVIKGTKRHPTLRDNVTVYANATILGGDTIIGNDATIPGNGWITESVKAKRKSIKK